MSADTCPLCDAPVALANAEGVKRAKEFFPPTVATPCPMCGAPPAYLREQRVEVAPATGDFVVSRLSHYKRVTLA